MEFVESLLVDGSRYLILATIFLTVTAAALVMLRAWQTATALDRRTRLQARPKGTRSTRPVAGDPVAPGDPVAAYYQALRKWAGNDVKERLLRAGYADDSAHRTFGILRIAAGLILFAAAYGIVVALGLAATPVKILAVALPAFGLGYLLPSFVLDRMVQARRLAYQRSFPDLIDMLVVCVEAGLTFEAAINRIARDTQRTDRMLSLHLQIVMLELRAGKGMRDALAAFAERIDSNDARSLISFVRQSEELGVSIGQSLRVFAAEMRQKRALLAEEKANALPAKMLLPIALFLFPVTLLIVLAPVLVTLMEFFKNGM